MSPSKISSDPTRFGLDTKVAVIGAGISGICTAAHLLKQGLDVTIFERSGVAGGVWHYQEETSQSPSYPSERPSVGDYNKVLSSKQENDDEGDPATHLIDSPSRKDLELAFSPPSACYYGLKTNVPTSLMYSSLKPWPKDSPTFVEHSAVESYLQTLSKQYGVDNVTHYWTRVEDVQKSEGKRGWNLRTISLQNGKIFNQAIEKHWHFDALVVANGHYNLPRVPDLPGLAELKQLFPDRVIHSKEYRHSKFYKDKNILVIGGGTSGADLCRELVNVAGSVTQSTRNGRFDLPEVLIPKAVKRVGSITRVEANVNEPLELHPEESIPAIITLQDGTELHGIDHILLATGYIFSFPFLSQFHSDTTSAEAMGQDGLVGAEGNMVHNLHKDIFYIEDPSLAFVGIPYHIVTFSTYDYQAQAVARVFSGLSELPTRDEMRAEYHDLVRSRGFGLNFHSQMEGDREVEYVRDLIDSVTRNTVDRNIKPIEGYTETWLKIQSRFKDGLNGIIEKE